FEFAPIGLSIAITGILYLTTIGRRFIPDRGGKDLVREYHIKEYLTEITIPAGSQLVGKTIRESGLRASFDLNVLGIVREGRQLLFPNQQGSFKRMTSFCWRVNWKI